MFIILRDLQEKLQINIPKKQFVKHWLMHWLINKHIKLNDRQSSFLESDISKITISQYMKLFDVSRNTAISDLDDLVSKRLVRKFKDAKTNVYKIL